MEPLCELMFWVYFLSEEIDSEYAEKVSIVLQMIEQKVAFNSNP